MQSSRDQLMIASSTEVATFYHAETASDFAACFDVIRQLRPKLLSAGDWHAQADEMRSEGYRVLVYRDGGRAAAIAGYRISTNLVHGRFLFVNDLVTLDSARGKGLGRLMLRKLERIAEAEGCEYLVLDTAIANLGARRFYTRAGMEERIAGFIKPIGAAA